MASPQVENGYTKIANEILEALYRVRIPGEAMQILMFIIRKTYGYNKKEDLISVSQFSESTGINKGNVCRAIRKLIKMGIVIKKDNGYMPTYCLQKNYEKWRPLSKKTTFVVQKDNKPLSKKTNTILYIKENKKIDERELIFKDSLNEYKNNPYGENMIESFFNYWSEPNKSNTKMRLELEKTWELSRRLKTWDKRSKEFEPKKKQSNKWQLFNESK